MTEINIYVFWLDKPFSVSFFLFHTLGKECHCQDDTTSDWFQIGNLAISELHPVFSSRCTHQVCYILRKTPRLSSKRIFHTLSRWGRQLSIVSGILSVPMLTLHALGASLGRRVQSRQEGFFEEIYVRLHSTFLALLGKFPDLNNSFSMWARQLL